MRYASTPLIFALIALSGCDDKPGTCLDASECVARSGGRCIEQTCFYPAPQCEGGWSLELGSCSPMTPSDAGRSLVDADRDAHGGALDVENADITHAGDSAGTDDAGALAPVVHLRTRRAFPTAFGQGEEVVTGGREGRAFFVDRLSSEEVAVLDETSDSYSGTFAGAMKLDECLTIYFRVAGVLDFRSDSLQLYNSDGCKTVVGASAPFPGATIFGARVANGSGATLEGNIILRGITILVGSTGESNVSSALSLGNGRTIVSDSTLGWAGDEAFGARGGDTIVQRNFFLQGFADHDTGGILGSASRAGVQPMGASQHNNVFYSNHRFLNACGDENDLIEIINNVAYYDGTRLNSHKCDLRLNDMNNYWVSRDTSRTIEHAHKWNASTSDNPECDDNPLIHASGNILTNVDGEVIFDGPGGGDERTMYRHHITRGSYTQNDSLPDAWFTSTPFPHAGALGGVIRTAREAYTNLVDERNAGARFYTSEDGVPTKYYPPKIDAYYQDIIDGTQDSALPDESRFTIEELGLPAAGQPYADADRDGMPDTFEARHGLDPMDPSDAMATKVNWDFGDYRVRNDAGYFNREICAEWMHGGFLLLLDYQAEGFAID